MASKPSKKTVALLAQFPALDHWIVGNLSASQLTHLTEHFEPQQLDPEHPLSSEAVGVGLWRAYKSEVLFELGCRGGISEFRPPKGPAGYACIHLLVCAAIALYATAQPELVDRAIARERGEIEAATGPAQAGGVSKASERRNRL